MQLVDIIGYIGMVLLIAGILLVRRKKYALPSDIMIAIASLSLAIDCLRQNIIPAGAVNVVVFFITLFNIRKDLKEEKRKEKDPDQVVSTHVK